MFYNSINIVILHSNAVCAFDHQTMYLFKYAICSSKVHIKNILYNNNYFDGHKVHIDLGSYNHKGLVINRYGYIILKMCVTFMVAYTIELR